MPTQAEEEATKKMREHMHSVFPDAATASRMAALASSHLPSGVSTKCCYPYYKELYALQIKKTIDEMIRSKETVIFRYNVWGETMSKQTLYTRINQSLRYLVECLDTPDMRYSSWRKLVNITRSEKRGGVVIEFIPEFRGGDTIAPFVGELVVPAEVGTPKWRLDMDEWIESDETRPFVRERLALTVEVVKELKLELKQIMGVAANVDCTSIRIIRMI